MNGLAQCPVCHAPLSGETSSEQEFISCGYCSCEVTATKFPANLRVSSDTPAEPVRNEDSPCFFHAENRAAAVCDSCGRFLCTVCKVQTGSEVWCPDCIAKNRNETSAPQFFDQTVLFDNTAFLLAFLSLLTGFYLVGGLLVALVSTGLIIYGWARQRTIVKRSRLRFVFAGLLAAVQGIGWIALTLWFAHAYTRVMQQA
jgi:hypothetical protein